MLSTSDLGWFAAVVDMKGKVVVKENKTRKTPQVVLIVDTKDERIGRRLAALTGTSPEPHDMRPLSDALRRGCKEHCPESHIHVHAEGQLPTITRWSITGLSMGVVIWNLRPYMSTYPEYAKYMGLAFDNAVLTGRGSGQVRASVNRLRDLGWRIPGRVTEGLKREKEPETDTETDDEAAVSGDA